MRWPAPPDDRGAAASPREGLSPPKPGGTVRPLGRAAGDLNEDGAGSDLLQCHVTTDTRGQWYVYASLRTHFTVNDQISR